MLRYLYSVNTIYIYIYNVYAILYRVKCLCFKFDHLLLAIKVFSNCM